MRPATRYSRGHAQGGHLSLSYDDVALSEASSLWPWLVVAEVADRLRCSTRTIHELTRTNNIPHLKRSGSRRCLFAVADLERWEQGADLEVCLLPDGGRIVTPVEGQAAP